MNFCNFNFFKDTLFATSNLTFAGMLISFFSWPILFGICLIVAASAYCIAKYDLFWHDCVKSKYADSVVFENNDFLLFFMWLIMALIFSLLTCFAIPTGFALNVFVVFWLSLQLLYKILKNNYIALEIFGLFLIFVILFGCAMSLVEGFPLLLGLFGPSKVVLSFELFKMSFVAGLSNPVFLVQSLILSLVLSNLIFKFEYDGLTVDLLACLFRVKNLRHVAATSEQKQYDTFNINNPEGVILEENKYNINLNKIFRLLEENPNMNIDLYQIKKGSNVTFGLDVINSNIAEVRDKKIGDDVKMSEDNFFVLFHLYDRNLDIFKNSLKKVKNEDQAEQFLLKSLRIIEDDEGLSAQCFVLSEFANNESLKNIIMIFAQDLRNNDAKDNGVGVQGLLMH